MLAKIEGKRKSRQQRMRWLDSITHSVDKNLSKLQKTLEDREAWHVAVHGVTKSQTRLSKQTRKCSSNQKGRITAQISNLTLSYCQTAASYHTAMIIKCSQVVSMKCLQKDRCVQSSTKKMQNPHGEKKKAALRIKSLQNPQ